MSGNKSPDHVQPREAKVRSAPAARALSDSLRLLANPEQARFLQRFFKTGPGQYAEGDVFLGIKVPLIRQQVRRFCTMSPNEAQKLVRSPIHEERLAGLLLWVECFRKGDARTRGRIFNLYLRNTRHINNWDLVDASAPHIVGGFLRPQDTALLDSLAGSELLWERRIAILATGGYIRKGIFSPTLRLCRRLLQDPHDLMHKACGWMLREVGKRDRASLSRFLERHAGEMPRTMLRYALEHYRPEERRQFMAQPKTPAKPKGA